VAHCLEDNVQTVGVRELKQHASELIRLVREEGRAIQITYRGEVVALLIPVTRPNPEEESQAWADLDRLATEIGVRWPAGVSAAQAIADNQ
jgi:prevent-host-death family protein